MNKIILSLVILVSIAFSYQGRYSQEQVLKDFNSGDTSKYRNDYLVELNSKTLIEKEILADNAVLTNTSVTEITVLAFMNGSGGYIENYIKCPTVGPKYTTSVWDYDLNSATIKCAVSEVNDLYNPLGYFTVSFPNIKKIFERDEKEAREKMDVQIKQSIERFNTLYKDKLDIKQSVTDYAGNNYLNIPDVLLSAILTDTDIIDVEATKTTSKLQLREGYNSQITDISAGNTRNNARYIEAHAETFIDVYTKLGDLSMTYLLLLVVFFGTWGLGAAITRPLMDKAEGLKSPDRKIPYMAGLIMGILLFFPTSDHMIVENNGVQQEYEVMHSKFQKYEKDGYYLFMNWANDAAEVIIDSELDSLIERSGISSEETIISAYTGKEKYKKMQIFSEIFYKQCEKIYDSDNVKVYTESKNLKFPTSENFLYARSLVVNNGPIYYLPTSNNGTVKSYAHGTPLLGGEFYPEYMISACGKAYQKASIYKQKSDDYAEKLESNLKLDEKTAGDKISMLKGLIGFQYKLLRDWGPLAVLGLPVTILQTKNVGELIDKSSSVTEKLEEQITADSWGAHMIFSSLPYLWIPGAGTTFQVATENSGKIAAGFGTAAAAAGTGGLLSWAGGLFGGAIGTIGGGAIGLTFAVLVGKTLLALAPILGIVLIGILRFVVIYLKIFTFHFASLFLLPIMFAKENVSAILSFSLKVFSTMLELPIFILSIWLALTANQIISSIGDAFSKSIILGMLENNELQSNKSVAAEWFAKIKIYLYDGLMEVGIAVFSIILIYKIIITLHTTIFELFELKSTQALDNSIESIKTESGNWGTKF